MISVALVGVPLVVVDVAVLIVHAVIVAFAVAVRYYSDLIYSPTPYLQEGLTMAIPLELNHFCPPKLGFRMRYLTANNRES